MDIKNNKTKNNYWPLNPNYKIWGLFMIVFYPWGLLELYLRTRRREARNRARIFTDSVFMSSANYVGGHPLLPTSCRVVIGLTKHYFKIYLLDNQSCFSTFQSIYLLDIIRTATGKPKTAREIYDEDHGHTIAVVEGSPFLQIMFKKDGDNYLMSFEDFDEMLPQEWHNQIVHLQYVLKQEVGHKKT